MSPNVSRVAIVPAALAAVLLVGGLEAAPPAPVLLGLGTLRGVKYVEVTLDTTRFAKDRTATIRIVNKAGFSVRGEIRACETIFDRKDPRFSPIRPVESGPFLVRPGQTVTITRPFQLVDPKLGPPDGGAYVLNDDLDAEPGCKD